MAGGHMKYRHLNRKSSHRQALLRNLVTSLITHESIKTTWHKAKETQRLAERLITLGKKNTNASRLQAQKIFYDPTRYLPTLFTTLRDRYLNRPGGYTRVLRIEPINDNHDQAPSAILELVDGPRDMRFAMTAKSLVRERSSEGGGIRDITARNITKVTRFRENGEEELERMVRRLETQKGWEEELEEEEEGDKNKRKETVGDKRALPSGSKKEGWERWDEVDKERRKKVKERAEKAEKKEEEARR